jgi:SAM-dependent methyltransferase
MFGSYHYDANENLWIRDCTKDFAYADGVEARLYEKLKSVHDRSVCSDELKALQQDWPSLYHFNYARTNLLRPLADAFKGKRILELGCGLGALTRFLGECGAKEVHAVEGSIHRARIAALRCSDLQNVRVICDQFENLTNYRNQYDVVTIIGVLEYSFLFSDKENPDLDLLRLAYEALDSDDGILILAIENKLGLKYLAGVPEDHLGASFLGIEDAYADRGVKTFSRKELQEKIRTAGFGSEEQYLAIPDYKLPKSIVFPEGLNSEDFDFVGILSHSQREYEQFPLFNLRNTWRSVARAGLTADLADSLCFVCHKADSKSIFKKNELAVHYGTSALIDFKYEKTVSFIRNGAGAIEVLRNGAAKNASDTGSKSISQCLEDEPWVTGMQMEEIIRKAFLQPWWSIDSVIQAFHPWVSWLRRYKEGDYLPSEFWDAIPSNLIQKPDGEIVFIDKEWRADRPIKFSIVLLRSLVVFIGRLGTVAQPQDLKLLNIRNLAEALFRSMCDESDKDLELRQLWVQENALDAGLFGAKGEKAYKWWDELAEQNLQYSSTSPMHLLADRQRLRELSQKEVQLEGDLRKSESDRQCLEQDLVHAKEEKGCLIEEKNSLLGEKQRLEKELAEVLYDRNRMLASRSWRVTKPLRHLAAALRNFAK